MLSASHWLLAQARFCGRTHLPLSPNSTMSTGQGDIPISSTGCTCFNIHHIHSTCGHGDILAITLLILSLNGCSCLNIHWYTAPVDMTFRWSRRSYQSICKQHPPYSHPQVMLIYYSLQDASQYSSWSQQCVVSTRPLISKFSSHFTNPLMTVSRAPITIGITVTFMFHCFFISLARFFLLSHSFTQRSARTAKSIIWQVLFSFFF